MKAEGGAKVAAIVKEVVQFCMDHEINIIQMPCPELLSEAGGFKRKPKGKKHYEAHNLNATARIIARGQVRYMKAFTESGCIVLGIIGVEFSPACSTVQTTSVYRQKGIYIEELEKELANNDLVIPMISIHPNWKSKMKRDLESLLDIA